ncbi:MAG: DUF1207 domain-containing protein [Planctomycetota bacterium]
MPRAAGCRVHHGPGLLLGIVLALSGAGLPAVEWAAAPADTIYPHYVADPQPPQMRGGLIVAFDSDLEQRWGVGSRRWMLHTGERMPVARATFGAQGQHRIQVDGEGGVHGQFDLENGLDNIGWDGWLALRLSYRRVDSPVALKLSYRHESSHIGDEFIERTGRGRLGYTREDLVLGVAWSPRKELTAYGAAGLGVNASSDFQEAGYARTGLQYIDSTPRFGPWGYAVGLDVQMFEENDWEPGISLRCALRASLAAERSFETAIEFYSGRSVLGEFSRDDERYLALTVTYDL